MPCTQEALASWPGVRWVARATPRLMSVYRVDGWTDGWMGGWVNGQPDGRDSHLSPAGISEEGAGRWGLWGSSPGRGVTARVQAGRE